MAANFDYCRDLVREDDRDRFLATLFAPAPRRAHLFALYAFDLETAAVARRVRDPLAGEIRFQWWHDTLSGASDIRGHPVAEAMRATMQLHRLDPQRALALIDARRAALYAQSLTDAEFEVQASVTAGAVFELACRILHGGENEAVRLASHHAGTARMAAQAQEEDRRELARRHLAALHALIASLPEAVLPAFLPLVLTAQSLMRPALPQWRRQWILWRAARNLSAWL